MTDIFLRFKSFKKNMIISDNAFNYELDKSKIKKSWMPIFEYYNENGDNVLDTEELAKLKADIDLADENQDDVISKEESKNLLHKILPELKLKKRHLNGFLKALQKNYIYTIENMSDGIIDWAAQGKVGDCWLLSEVRSMSHTEWGSKAIKDSICYNSENKTYRVMLKGVNFACEITSREIKKARRKHKKSKGDIDVLLLEIATEKYFRQEVEAGRMNCDTNNLLNGNKLFGKQTMQYMLTGNTGCCICIDNQKPELMSEEEVAEWKENAPDEYAHLMENENVIFYAWKDEQKNGVLEELAKEAEGGYSVICTFKESSEWNNPDKYSDEEKQDEFSNTDCHAYMIEAIIIRDDGSKFLILNNPHEPNILLYKEADEFFDQVECIYATNKDDNYEQLKSICAIE